MLDKKVTVLMPIYNGELYVKEAVDSVLKQTYIDFELLIINDGSTDKSEKIIKEYDDKRIVYIKNKHNIGLIKTLNKGLSLIKSEYIIRMDADDICYPERFEKQIEYMDKNTDIVVSGTSVISFDEKGRKKKRIVYSDSKDNRTYLMFGSPLAHPSVIIRNNILNEFGYMYDEKLDTVEDYGLWLKISENHEIGNIRKPLLYYRVNAEGITQQANKKIEFRDNQHKEIYKRVFTNMYINFTNEELQTYREFITGRTTDLELLQTILTIIKSKLKSHDLNKEIIVTGFKNYFAAMYIKNNLSISDLHDDHKKYFKNIFTWSFFDDFKFFIKKLKRRIM